MRQVGFCRLSRRRADGWWITSLDGMGYRFGVIEANLGHVACSEERDEAPETSAKDGMVPLRRPRLVMSGETGERSESPGVL